MIIPSDPFTTVFSILLTDVSLAATNESYFPITSLGRLTKWGSDLLETGVEYVSPIDDKIYEESSMIVQDSDILMVGAALTMGDSYVTYNALGFRKEVEIIPTVNTGFSNSMDKAVDVGMNPGEDYQSLNCLPPECYNFRQPDKDMDMDNFNTINLGPFAFLALLQAGVTARLLEVGQV